MANTKDNNDLVFVFLKMNWALDNLASAIETISENVSMDESIKKSLQHNSYIARMRLAEAMIYLSDGGDIPEDNDPNPSIEAWLKRRSSKNDKSGE